MIEIGDSYRIKRDRYCWILCIGQEGKDKDGNPKRSWRESYHANLGQVARHIADSACEAAETVDGLVGAVNDAALRIETALAAEAEGDRVDAAQAVMEDR